MPKLKKGEVAEALEQREIEQLRLWVQGKSDPPDCSNCDFEYAEYCERHEEIIKELWEDEGVVPFHEMF